MNIGLRALIYATWTSQNVTTSVFWGIFQRRLMLSSRRIFSDGSQGQKVTKKGSKTQPFQGEKATCQKMNFWNASPVALGNL